ncbi:hypothetical protein [Cellulomonas composti]|uniref:Uncharacterized protein n=1 Tax=Cellulomonas composti TaxID=266130 RepID=A0A511J7P1_9CELL|nr:hypothetical protein [Cellulomonas composti]GEL93998.1 hypothetical protein CCO02nite_06560 [Cellulomonas composti]
MTSAPSTEYDRFGPWIDRVESPDDVPRLFRGHEIDFGSSPTVLKVPRNVARRDAHPAMDLYDHLVVLQGRTLTCLSRRTTVADGPGFDRTDVPVDDVVAIRDAVSLLDGSLTIRSRTGAQVRFAYNGSARSAVTGLVDELRGLLTPAAPASLGGRLRAATAEHALPTSAIALQAVDVALVSDHRAAARALPGLTAWACHDRVVVTPRPGGLVGSVRRALHALNPMTLHGGVLAGDDVALEVFGRHASLIRGRAPALSASRLVVPWAGLDRVEVEPHPVYEGVSDVVLVGGASTSTLHLPSGSRTTRVLTAAVERAQQSPPRTPRD